MNTSLTETVVLGRQDENWLAVVREYVGSVQFGTVEVVVRDQRVVEIEKTERVRLVKPGEGASGGAAIGLVKPRISGPGLGSGGAGR